MNLQKPQKKQLHYSSRSTQCSVWDTTPVHFSFRTLIDVLSADQLLLGKAPRFRLIGNLPYNIGSPLLFHCLNFIDLFYDMHFMLQKETVDRIIASPGSKAYGRLSVMVQYHCTVKKLFDVPPSAFWPRPAVDSSVFRLVSASRDIVVKDMTCFQRVVQKAFSQRRKMIGNSLTPLISKEALYALGIDRTQRPEQLSVDDFVKISCSAQIQSSHE